MNQNPSYVLQVHLVDVVLHLVTSRWTSHVRSTKVGVGGILSGGVKVLKSAICDSKESLTIRTFCGQRSGRARSFEQRYHLSSPSYSGILLLLSLWHLGQRLSSVSLERKMALMLRISPGRTFHRLGRLFQSEQCTS